MGRKLEMHMPSDRPGMLMRKRLNALLETHGEREVPRGAGGGAPEVWRRREWV
jgi:hypothetical protein